MRVTKHGSLAVLAIVGALVVACAPTSGAPAPTSRAPAASGAAAPASGERPAAAARDISAQLPTGSTSRGPDLQPNPAEWERARQAARQEGRVVLMAPPFPGLRQTLTEEFQRTHGISLEYIGAAGGEHTARVEREAAAGTITVDAIITGSNTCWTLGERGLLDNVLPLVVAPEVVNPAAWRGGRLHPLPPSSDSPPDFYCGLQTTEWVMTDLFVNSQMVPPSAIKSWKDLLKPEYKGKIAAYDPRRSGPGQHVAGYLASLFGEQYLRDLFVGQEPTFTSDYRQLGEWVARGTYPIGIGLVQAGVEPFKSQGLPLERVFPEDGPGGVTSGFGIVFRVKNAPHPNAATVFLNWFASQEGQELYEREMMEVSLRDDVSHNVPDYVIPKVGVEYKYRNEDPETVAKYREPTAVWLRELLGR